MKKLILFAVTIFFTAITANAEVLDYDISYDMAENNMNVIYTLHNSDAEPKSAVLLIVLYEDGKMLRFKETATSIPANGTKTETAVLPLEAGGSSYTVKVMAFENLSNLKPLNEFKFIKDVEPYSRQKQLYINSDFGDEINFYMNSTQTIGNNEEMVHTVIYDVLSLLPVDLCGFTYEKEMTSGEIENTGIIVNKVDLLNGRLEFSFKSPDGRNTGINNFIKFKALRNLIQEDVIYTMQEVN